MKPTLKNQPNGYTQRELFARFEDGKPLSANQLNFLSRHEKLLSAYGYDPLLKYYLKPYHTKADHSFLMHHEAFNKSSIMELKKRISLLLDKQQAHVEFKMKPEQFLQFRAETVNELIFYHGNQFLTGAPFHHGGIAPILFFQWGNLFGVCKYVLLAEEKALKSNVLIYFEDMNDRYLEQCVMDYQHKMQHNLSPQQQLHHKPYTPTPALSYHSPFAIPTLTLSRHREKKEEQV